MHVLHQYFGLEVSILRVGRLDYKGRIVRKLSWHYTELQKKSVALMKYGCFVSKRLLRSKCLSIIRRIPHITPSMCRQTLLSSVYTRQRSHTTSATPQGVGISCPRMPRARGTVLLDFVVLDCYFQLSPDPWLLLCWFRHSRFSGRSTVQCTTTASAPYPDTESQA